MWQLQVGGGVVDSRQKAEADFIAGSAPDVIMQDAAGSNEDAESEWCFEA